MKLYRFYLQGARGHKLTLVLWTLRRMRCTWKLSVHGGHLGFIFNCDETYVQWFTALLALSALGLKSSSADSHGYYSQRRRRKKTGERGHKRCYEVTFPLIHGPNKPQTARKQKMSCGCHKFYVLDLPLIKPDYKLCGKPDFAFQFSLKSMLTCGKFCLLGPCSCWNLTSFC